MEAGEITGGDGSGWVLIEETEQMSDGQLVKD